ncbi:MAG: glutaminase [Syntrophothermus sp.]
MDYKEILEGIFEEVKKSAPSGNAASYIPELATVDPDHYGITLLTVDGREHNLGDAGIKFSIQSISKVFSLSYAVSLLGEKVFERVGVEPSGNSFNSIMQLEYEKGIPRNPFINAGALVIADILVTHLKNPETDFLEFVRAISGSPDIISNEKVYLSEKQTGYRNAALINMMKSYGNIYNDIDAVLSFYYMQCSLEMSCRQLAQAFLPYAKLAVPFDYSGVKLTKSQLKRINALMLSNGFYDESGEFAFEVGLPGKSGVGGGIAALHPNHYSVAVWSPRINEKGNSVFGMRTLEMLTTRTEDSIF